MYTHCTPGQLHFHTHGRRDVVARFDGGRITSDAGGVLLRETELRLGLMARLARCFRDYCKPGSVEHPVRSLVAQRVYALALGYEDLNDHEECAATVCWRCWWAIGVRRLGRQRRTSASLAVICSSCSWSCHACWVANFVNSPQMEMAGRHDQNYCRAPTLPQCLSSTVTISRR